MTVRFADSACQYCGQICLAFGWSPDQFWAATPADVQVILNALTNGENSPPEQDIIDKLMEQFPDG